METSELLFRPSSINKIVVRSLLDVIVNFHETVAGFALGIGVEILFATSGKKIATKSPPERPNPIIYN